SGADGVMVAGCEEGSCHFINGNLRAKKRVEFAKKLLEETGVNPDRLEMYHISASQGPLFALKSREFTERIADLNAKSSEELNCSTKVTNGVSI
ncbi:hydrogenase iron-sulfur subunit, partial [Candidatus Latescibacterota bacterium]